MPYCVNCKKHVPKGHRKTTGHLTFALGRLPSTTHPYRHIRQFIRNPLPVPDELDLEIPGEPISDQEEVGCCVAEAWMNVKSSQNARDSGTWTSLSPKFIYDVGRKDNGSCSNSGMESVWGPQVLQKYGDCPETDDPFVNSETCTNPSQQATADAKNYMVGNIGECTSVDDMKQAVLHYNEIAIGIPVYNSIVDVGSDGIIPMPQPGESDIGGHELCIKGWKVINGIKYFKVKNSWWIIPKVTPWGDRGYGYLQEAYMTQFFGNGGADSYSAVDKSTPPPSPPPTPGEIVLSVSPTTILNDGSITETSQITGTTSGDSIEVDVITPTDEVLFLAGGTAQGTTLVLSGTLVASYTGPAVVQAFDHTAVPSLVSNQVPVTIAAPSPCKLGNKACRMLNAVPVWPIRRFPFLRARRGRFYYLND